MFTIGKVYNRRKDLHKVYGGNSQSGIAPCAKHPIVFIFTSPTGKKHGYRDHWLSETVFQYTGEGQYGDMELVRGNRAIVNHVKDGRQLHLFEDVGHGDYRYLGEMAYLDHEVVRGEDTDKNSRNMIVFRLQRVHSK
ncbi:MAG TPA: hypothetical protein PLV53_08020 [Anaerolineaceae bacterium]|nr:hypothetical protein [Anaerolineaceae bacterium]